MSTTSIEWTDRVWNPVRGCSVISPGCHNCYAMKQAHRFSGPGGAYEGLTKQTKAGPQWTGAIRVVDDALLAPLTWRSPARVFVNSMSDLFHEAVPDAFIDRVFVVMALAERHTFQILTKRAQRMRDYFADEFAVRMRWLLAANEIATEMTPLAAFLRQHGWNQLGEAGAWPLPHVWLLVSCEDQPSADKRIDLLLQTPAAVRGISAEPLLARLDLARWLTPRRRWPTSHYNMCGASGDSDRGCFVPWCSCPCHAQPETPALDWVIVGGESGPRARPCALEWIERLVAQGRTAAVPVFVKQLGGYIVSEARTAPLDVLGGTPGDYRGHYAPNGEIWAWRAGTRDSKGGDPAEWSADLRVREFPRAIRQAAKEG